MKVYLVMYCEDYGDSWVHSVYAKREDAELEVESMNSQLSDYSHYSYHISELEVL